ncbi:hypothetical protein BABINDRAFT_25839, partial [Babjeviella inositovora NRRL Y-12698]
MNYDESASPSEKKRAPAACLRCRQRHIKCPGGEPCSKCFSSKAKCVYVEADRKIVVSVKYLAKLQEELQRSKQENERLRRLQTLSGAEPLDEAFSNLDAKLMAESEVLPPYLDKYGKLFNSKGSKFYLGSSSITLFGMAIQNLIPHDSHPGSRVPSSTALSSLDHAKEARALENEGNAYKIVLSHANNLKVKFTLPSFSYAILLVDTFVTYNDACFYFFNEGQVKEKLREIYEPGAETDQDRLSQTIWYCKILLVFAIGEMYLGTIAHAAPPDLKRRKKNPGTNLPGSAFFQQASELFTGLFAAGHLDNITHECGIEVCLLYAFYLQVADFTVLSFFYFGLALRASLVLGFHVDAGKNSITRYELEHRRRLWWTVYIYERMLSSKIGLPLLVTDECVSTALPSDFDMTQPPAGCEHYIFPEAEILTTTIRITKINAKVLARLYTRQPTSNILPTVVELVDTLVDWKKALPDYLTIDWSSCISRLQVNLLSEFFQGINLAIRPLVFHFVMKQLKVHYATPRDGASADPVYIDLTSFPQSILSLLNTSFRSSIDMIRSLWSLFKQNQVALFGFMDREYLYGALATLILFNVAFGVYSTTIPHIDHGLAIMVRMARLGNFPAHLRVGQLVLLIKKLDLGGNEMCAIIEKYEGGREDERSSKRPPRDSSTVSTTP